MDLLQALGTLMSFTAFGLVGAGVMKAFHISNDLSEIKELLRDIRRNGEDPSRRAMNSNCLLATIYHRFGIDVNHTYQDRTGRPIPILQEGEPIAELL